MAINFVKFVKFGGVRRGAVGAFGGRGIDAVRIGGGPGSARFFEAAA